MHARTHLCVVRYVTRSSGCTPVADARLAADTPAMSAAKPAAATAYMHAQGHVYLLCYSFLTNRFNPFGGPLVWLTIAPLRQVADERTWGVTGKGTIQL